MQVNDHWSHTLAGYTHLRSTGVTPSGEVIRRRLVSKCESLHVPSEHMKKLIKQWETHVPTYLFGRVLQQVTYMQYLMA